MFPKSKRVVNKELLEEIGQHNCLACGRRGPSDAHHVTTKGAGGGDTIDNIIPLCRRDHTRIHTEGMAKFAWRYPQFKEWLTKHNRFDVLSKL